MSREIADRRLWFTADKSELVEEGDPRAAFLAAIPGREVPDVALADDPEQGDASPDEDDEPVSGLTIHTEDEPTEPAEKPAQRKRTTSRKTTSKKDD